MSRELLINGKKIYLLATGSLQQPVGGGISMRYYPLAQLRWRRGYSIWFVRPSV